MAASDSPNGLKVTWYDMDGTRHVVASGEIDMSNSEVFQAALDAEHLRVDMTHVTFIDSTGLRSLLEAKALAQDGLVLIGCSPQVQRILELSGVGGEFFES